MKHFCAYIFKIGMQEMWVWSLSQEDPLKEETKPTPVFLSGKSYGQKSLASYSSWAHKRVRHSLVTKQQQWKLNMLMEKNIYLGFPFFWWTLSLKKFSLALADVLDSLLLLWVGGNLGGKWMLDGVVII